MSNNKVGILADASSTIVGNVITNSSDVAVKSDPGAGAGLIAGNAVIGNENGIEVGADFSGKVTQNNIFGISGCGLTGPSSLMATDNYWGKETAPTVDSANADVCTGSGTPIVTPFSPKPFNIKPKITP